MVATNAHGGRCCGIKHIYNLGMSPTQGNIKAIEDIVDWNGKGASEHCQLLEVVINGAQARRGWKRELKRLGFRYVSKFKNRNSGHVVYVFHWHKLPRNWR